MLFFYVLAIFSTSSLASAYEFKQCDGEANGVIEITKFNLKPDPIVTPGRVTIDLEWKVLKTPKADQKYTLSVKTTMKFPMIEGWKEVPCVKGLGSCKYDLCDTIAKVAKLMKSQGLECGDSFPCSCETMEEKTYKMNDLKLDLPKIPLSVPYRSDVKLFHAGQPDDVLACMHFEYKLKAKDCEGIFCLG